MSDVEVAAGTDAAVRVKALSETQRKAEEKAVKSPGRDLDKKKKEARSKKRRSISTGGVNLRRSKK